LPSSRIGIWGWQECFSSAEEGKSPRERLYFRGTFGNAGAAFDTVESVYLSRQREPHRALFSANTTGETFLLIANNLQHADTIKKPEKESQGAKVSAKGTLFAQGIE